MRLVEAAASLFDLSLDLSELRGEVLGVHARENLSGLDHVALVREHFGDAPREFGVDIDFVRLNPTVS